jgi:hypothetical protein
MNGELKMNGFGNGPVAALAFLSSFAVSGADLLARLVVMLLVAALGKGIDVLIKQYRAARRESWRRRALKAETELAKLKGDAH